MKTKTVTPFKFLPIALATLVLSSCVPSVGSSLRSRDSSAVSTSVAVNQGRILADNPIILSKNASLSDSYDLNKLLSTDTITTNSFLKGNTSCYGLDYCFEVRENKDAASALQTSNGKWGYDASTSEFLQVNTFYHLNKVTNMFYSNLATSFSRAYFGTTPYYKTALPPISTYSPNYNINPSSPQYYVSLNPLIAYSKCDAQDNSYFDRATLTLCFGYVSNHPNVFWAQDSTVIYHETGHFFQRFQLNIRNNPIGSHVDMGNLNYDEAGSIGEGLSDFYSYYVNGRPHFAEWAAGRFLAASRPMTENDPLHVAGVSTASDQRLSYPTYLNYNPNYSTIPFEDVHYAGMIISHYLVALVTDLQDKCSMTQRDASDLVVHLLTETLAEHGDLNANGIQSITNNLRINLNPTYSADWFKTVNPINYRTFMQTFAKNLLNNIGNPLLNRCNGSIYTKDQIEGLIDQYGLLLFRTYNENRNQSNPATLTNTAVSSTNRTKSVLISKNLLILDPTANASSAYVIDDQSTILSALTSLQASGIITTSLSAQTPSDLGFNNNNGKVSPGEVVGIALNLYNNSNSTMGGIQILANDWNHADTHGNPCLFSTTRANDQWPLASEGGVPCPTTSATVATDFAPVCFMQAAGTSSTQWISQSAFRSNMALDNSLCLDPSNDKNCFIRAIKGADQAHYSKLNPKSTWSQTMTTAASGTPKLNWGNVLLFEVSKQIPPGTVIDCRLRVRFTNCDDCYHDANRSNYDYTDTEYNGPTPYKIIHLQIPITD
jgi:hypothetical protein